MTPEELQKLTQDLVDSHARITEYGKRRPRKAAKELCKEFRKLFTRDDFWDELTARTEHLIEHEEEANILLGDMRRFLAQESEILVRLGIDEQDARNVLDPIFQQIRVVDLARNAEITPDSVDVLRSLLGQATRVICDVSRGPILRTMDFVFSKKGAAALGGIIIVPANIAIVVGTGADVLASVKVGIAIATGQLADIADLGENLG